MSQKERLNRLLPNGYPRYVRCYDDGGKSADRYTVVFNGRYNNRVEASRREYIYMGMSAAPFHPQGVCQLGYSKDLIDVKDGRWTPAYGDENHLGKRIHWHELPTDCQKAALHTYKEIWDLYVAEAKVTGRSKLAAGIPGGVRIIRKDNKRRPH